MPVMTAEQQYNTMVAATEAKAAKVNAEAEWSAFGQPLCEMGHVVHRRIPPKEFSLKYTGVQIPKESNGVETAGIDINYELYSWVTNHLDLDNPIHHLALMISLVLCRIPPFISYRHTAPQFKAHGASARERLTEAIRREPWIKPETGDETGKRDGEPYVVLFIGYFLALYDPDSPLLRLCAGEGGAKLRTAFTAKHIKKGLNIFNIIRLGLAYPLNGRAIKGGRLNTDWKFEDEATLVALHDRFIEYFQDEPFGMYHAVVELVGHDRADALVQTGQLKRRVGVLREPSTQMPIPATMAGSSAARPSGSQACSASAHTGSLSVVPAREHMTTLVERYNIQPPAPATAVARVSGSRRSVAPGRSQPPQPAQRMSEKRAGKQRTCLFCTLIRSQYANVICYSGKSSGARAYAECGCPSDPS